MLLWPHATHSSNKMLRSHLYNVVTLLFSLQQLPQLGFIDSRKLFSRLLLLLAEWVEQLPGGPSNRLRVLQRRFCCSVTYHRFVTANRTRTDPPPGMGRHYNPLVSSLRVKARALRFCAKLYRTHFTTKGTHVSCVAVTTWL